MLKRVLLCTMLLIFGCDAYIHAQSVLAKPVAKPRGSSSLITPYDLSGASSFEDFLRYTSEQRNWVVMDGVGTAYFRDVFVGGDTMLFGLLDQEQWYATATRPDGSTIQWSTITFYVNYQGMSNCFVGFGMPTYCGSNQLDVLWYTQVQCAPTGTWRMTFFDSGSSTSPISSPAPMEATPHYSSLEHSMAADSDLRMSISSCPTRILRIRLSLCPRDFGHSR